MSFARFRHHSTHGPGGFTIIELLAVVTTVTLLGWVIIPAMSRTTVSSQSVQCINHLNQLMEATLMYASDNNELLPPNPDDGTVMPGYVWCAGQAGVGGADEFDLDLLADPTRNLMAPYLHSNPEAFHCPADPRSGIFDGAALYPNSSRLGTRVSVARSVSMNQAVGTVDPCFANGAGHCGAPKLAVNGPWLTGAHGANSASAGPWRTYGSVSWESFASNPPLRMGVRWMPAVVERVASLLSLQPFPSRPNLRGIEILHLRHSKWLADFGHPLFPLLFTHQRNLSDVRAMFGRELNVIPERMEIPAVEVVELSK